MAATIRAGIQTNDPELYVLFLDIILALGRRDCDRGEPWLTAFPAEITAPTLVACADRLWMINVPTTLINTTVSQ